MKYKSKSALILKAIAVLLTLALTGCDSIDWPHIWGDDEIPFEVKAAPREVVTPAPVSEDALYPRLGDVPSMPKNFTPQDKVSATMDEMETDRNQALKMQQDVQPPLIDMPKQKP